MAMLSVTRTQVRAVHHPSRDVRLALRHDGPAHSSEIDRTSAGQMRYGGEILAEVVTVGVVSTPDCRLS
jgi:hypothetical protein